MLYPYSNKGLIQFSLVVLTYEWRIINISFDFSTKGEKGSRGDKGSQGEKGSQGQKGIQGTCDTKVIIIKHFQIFNLCNLLYNSFYESLINFITIDFIHVLHSRSLLFPVMFKGRRVHEWAARPWQVTIEIFTGWYMSTHMSHKFKERGTNNTRSLCSLTPNMMLSLSLDLYLNVILKVEAFLHLLMFD